MTTGEISDLFFNSIFVDGVWRGGKLNSSFP